MSCLLSAGTHKSKYLRSILRAMLTSGSVVSPIFFNREKEMTQMIDCLKTHPAVNVFTGPPNCGKTILF